MRERKTEHGTMLEPDPSPDDLADIGRETGIVTVTQIGEGRCHEIRVAGILIRSGSSSTDAESIALPIEMAIGRAIVAAREARS